MQREIVKSIYALFRIVDATEASFNNSKMVLKILIYSKNLKSGQ